MSEPLPRVTAILAAVGLGPDFSAVAPATLEIARARGTAVHAALEAHAYGYLDAAGITPAVAPYVSAYLKFLAESQHEPIASELRVEHPAWRYVGHVDRVGWLAGRRILLDWKTGEAVDLMAAGRQLAGYRLAYNAGHPTEPVESVAVVQLRDDGTYRFREDTVNDPTHEQIFLAAVLIWHARHGKEPA